MFPLHYILSRGMFFEKRIHLMEGHTTHHTLSYQLSLFQNNRLWNHFLKLINNLSVKTKKIKTLQGDLDPRT